MQLIGEQVKNNIAIEKIIGGGIIRNDSLTNIANGTPKFSVYGSLASVLSPEVINTISINTQKISKNILMQTKYKDKAELISYLLYLVAENAAISIKKLSINKDISEVCKYIIQLLKYCINCSGNKNQIVIDCTMDGILASLPISKEDAKSIYIYKNINSLYELKEIRLDSEMRYSLGYLIYYLYSAQGIDIKYNKYVIECYELLGIQKADINNFKEHFKIDKLEKSKHVILTKNILGDLKREKFDIDYDYTAKAIRKMSYYTSIEREKDLINIVSDGFIAYYDKDQKKGINVISDALLFLCEGLNRKIEKDDLFENVMQEMKSFGIDNNVFDNEIIPTMEDKLQVIED